MEPQQNLNQPPAQQQPTTYSTGVENGPSKMKKWLPIGIGVIISLVVIALVFGVLQNVFTRASDEKPSDVAVSEITQNSAKVTWTTDGEVQSLVEYGTSPTSLNFNAPETEKTKNHEVELTLLSPSTTYYFQIGVGDKKFDNGGIPWTFSTKSTQETQSVATPSPTLIQQLTPTTTTISPTSSLSCTETDCEAIKSKLGKGCTTQDYFKCVKKTTPTATP